MPELEKQTVPTEKKELYRLLASQLNSLMEGEREPLPNMANMCALLYGALPAVNWAGFYLNMGAELMLGPFQGRPACIRIPLGRGVCGTAAALRNTQLVPDVHAFPGHIACDAASRSEIVVPLMLDDRLLGVLDVDSPVEKRFDADDRAGLEALAEQFVRHCCWPMLV